MDGRGMCGCKASRMSPGRARDGVVDKGRDLDERLPWEGMQTSSSVL
jgi:hypothetical protein